MVKTAVAARVLALFLFSFLMVSCVNNAEWRIKVGVVDIEHIYASYGKARVSADEIQSRRDEQQIEANKKQVDLQVLVNEYNRTSETMTEEQRQAELKKIRDLRTEILTFTQLSSERLTAENREMIQLRLNEIAEVIQEYARKNRFDMVVDKKSLPFFSDALNISDEIIKILNR